MHKYSFLIVLDEKVQTFLSNWLLNFQHTTLIINIIPNKSVRF